MSFLKDESNGYIQHKNINGYDFTVMYRPTDLLVEQELENSNDNKQVKQLREQYGEYLYFNLSISKNNKELLSSIPKDLSQFSGLVNQLTFEMDSKVCLLNLQKDTIQLLDFVYPRLYGMSNSTTMMFIYQKEIRKMNTEYLIFSLKDFGLSTGRQQFKFKTNNILNQPKINFSKNN